MPQGRLRDRPRPVGTAVSDLQLPHTPRHRRRRFASVVKVKGPARGYPRPKGVGKRVVAALERHGLENRHARKFGPEFPATGFVRRVVDRRFRGFRKARERALAECELRAGASPNAVGHDGGADRHRALTENVGELRLDGAVSVRLRPKPLDGRAAPGHGRMPGEPRGGGFEARRHRAPIFGGLNFPHDVEVHAFSLFIREPRHARERFFRFERDNGPQAADAVARRSEVLRPGAVGRDLERYLDGVAQGHGENHPGKDCEKRREEGAREEASGKSRHGDFFSGEGSGEGASRFFVTESGEAHRGSLGRVDFQMALFFRKSLPQTPFHWITHAHSSH